MDKTSNSNFNTSGTPTTPVSTSPKIDKIEQTNTKGSGKVKEAFQKAGKSIAAFGKKIGTQITQDCKRLWATMKGNPHIWIASAFIAVAIVIGALITITVLTIKSAIKKNQEADAHCMNVDLLADIGANPETTLPVDPLRKKLTRSTSVDLSEITPKDPPRERRKSY